MKTTLFFLIFLVLVTSVAAVPQLPMIVNGKATINDKGAGKGTIVSAVADNKVVGQANVSADGKYVLLLQEPVAGTIKLYVAGVYSGKEINWTSGGFETLDLAVKKQVMKNILYYTAITALILVLLGVLFRRKLKWLLRKHY